MKYALIIAGVALLLIPCGATAQQYAGADSSSASARDSAQQIRQRIQAQEYREQEAARLAEHQARVQAITQKGEVEREEMGKAGLWFWGLLFASGVALTWARNAYT